MEQYFCTFKYYDAKGRRLAVFIRYLNATEAEIFTLTCSLEDIFDKQFARNAYEEYLNTGLSAEFIKKFKPAIELIEIEPERREIYTLLKFCNKNYFVEAEMEVRVDVPILYNEENCTGFGELNITIKSL